MASFAFYQPLSPSPSPTVSSSLSTLRKTLIPDLNPKSTNPLSSFPLLQPKTLTLFPNLKPLTFRPPHSSIDITPVAAATSNQPLKSRLKNGETLYGIFLLTFSPTIAEIAGLAGYDFAVVDMEHGHGGISDALPCLHALAATNTAAILRVPESSATWAKKALDLGPQGIMFPMIDGPKSARKAVSYCRFPPNGVRGSAHTIVRASDYGINEGYLNNYEEELLVMCQVESEDGAKKIEEIANVDGVDCIQMGPLDLSASMGYLWDPGNKKVREVIRAAEKGVLKGGGAYLSGFVMPHDGAEELRRRGYHMVSGAADVGLFRTAAVEDVKKFKMSLAEEESDEEKENGKVPEEKYWSE
ncbi:UNVERIFIED_CONTAM: 4-hydroxy-2-oxovalerate aldolase [Sesamum radiatum]|uniref:4-hydroxy-2-oxovalerate aldolase n=1 Tax=Sesamum radiatum TaxID=300843 RepID=A0AAW2TY27_SESRA